MAPTVEERQQTSFSYLLRLMCQPEEEGSDPITAGTKGAVKGSTRCVIMMA
jgi:hypothetical protein